ncbi:hypothetical protein B0H34DRAFT_801519 [Crassisporium funariophilum]|nr:hypothetical protein B0H34DRAFT_801519 [Crassisporium funariophilum]
MDIKENSNPAQSPAPDSRNPCSFNSEPTQVESPQDCVHELLKNMKRKCTLPDTIPEDQTDGLLNALSYKDFPQLRRARAKLSIKGKDKLLNIFFRSRITGMVGTLNLYLDPELSYTWRQASLLASKAAGHGMNHARNLCMWILCFLNTGKLPLHRYGTFHSSILEDEDIAQGIQLHLLEIAKKGYIRAQDIVDYIAMPEVQEQLAGKTKTTIHERTACRWLKKPNWRYARKENGMYVDGHKRADVVQYRTEFIAQWAEYEKRFLKYDNDGNPTNRLVSFPVAQVGRFRIILVTHDESTFYANDCRKTKWIHASATAVAEAKGEGQSLMASEFCVPEWGPLRDGIETARIIFKAGKNRDGWFASEDLLAQVDTAIDVFEGRTNGFATGLSMFDNAPSHQKRAPDALSARKMPKNPHKTWRQHKDGPRMQTTTFTLGGQTITQDFYFSDDHSTMPGWFKGMENIIQERGLWNSQGLNAQCEGFKCAPGKTDCCCRHLLFTQPDFIAQKSHLEEFITSHGHICDFYPKYHCKLNFIEQFWGAAKFRYRSTPKTTDIDEMEKNVVACLDEIPQLQILRYVNHSARFINAYAQGLSGPEAAWANKKYHGHRTLPPDMIASLKNSHQEYMAKLAKLNIASQAVV